jgi:hypothetical protein
MQNKVMDDRYDNLITGNAHLFDAIEVHGVRDINLPGDTAGTFCEVNDENPQFYSVYLHYISEWDHGCIECVGDHATHELALCYANDLSAMYGWRIVDCVGTREAVTGGAKRWPMVDRHGRPLYKGCKIRAQVCTGRYGQTRIVEGMVDQAHYEYCCVIVGEHTADFQFDSSAGLLRGYHKHVDFEHGHETWVDLI